MPIALDVKYSLLAGTKRDILPTYRYNFKHNTYFLFKFLFWQIVIYAAKHYHLKYYIYYYMYFFYYRYLILILKYSRVLYFTVGVILWSYNIQYYAKGHSNFRHQPKFKMPRTIAYLVWVGIGVLMFCISKGNFEGNWPYHNRMCRYTTYMHKCSRTIIEIIIIIIFCKSCLERASVNQWKKLLEAGTKNLERTVPPALARIYSETFVHRISIW